MADKTIEGNDRLVIVGVTDHEHLEEAKRGVEDRMDLSGGGIGLVIEVP